MDPLLLMYGSLPQQREVRWLAAGDPTDPLIVMIHVEGLSANPNDPTAEELRAKMAAARLPSGADSISGRGDWVGVKPRVVRMDYSAPISYTISAAWPYAWSVSGPQAPVLIDSIVANVRREMASIATLSGDWRVTAIPFNEAINGPLAWWQSGAASITQTGDSSNVIIPTVGEAHENPIGPTSDATRPPSGNPADALAKALPWVVGIGAVGVAGWLGINAYTASRTVKRVVSTGGEK